MVIEVPIYYFNYVRLLPLLPKMINIFKIEPSPGCL